jgi:phage terminase Nu1 subunit (DNA packaging protein)
MAEAREAASLSIREFARLRGVTRSAVQERIAAGTMPTSVKRINGQWRIVDVNRANEEWETQGRTRIDTTGRGEPSALAAATVRERLARAELLELRNAIQVGDLVPAKQVEQQWAAAIVGVRTALLGLPSRARARLPHLTTAEMGVLDRLIREALADLAAHGEDDRTERDAG